MDELRVLGLQDRNSAVGVIIADGFIFMCLFVMFILEPIFLGLSLRAVLLVGLFVGMTIILLGILVYHYVVRLLNNRINIEESL